MSRNSADQESEVNVAVHPRLSVNSLSSVSQPMTEDLEMWGDLKVRNVGLVSPKLAAIDWNGEVITASGLNVSNIAIEERVMDDALRFAHNVGAEVVYITSGWADGMSWGQAAKAFCERIEPAARKADELGVRLAVEPTIALRADLSFVFTFRDAVDLARDAGIAVVLDLYSCWFERDLARLVRENLDVLALVQICDYSFGTPNTPNRSVIGDGDIPLERLLGDILDAGYTDIFDIEILGPRIEEEGYRSAVSRSVDRASKVLDRLGAT
jgi:sugar phosphate isomerase/epimerase